MLCMHAVGDAQVRMGPRSTRSGAYHSSLGAVHTHLGRPVSGCAGQHVRDSSRQRCPLMAMGAGLMIKALTRQQQCPLPAGVLNSEASFNSCKRFSPDWPVQY